MRDNYLLPIEFAIETVEEIHNRAISTIELRSRIMSRSVRNLFIVIDACRNELDAKGTDPYKLVAPEDNPPGTLAAFATDYGQTATYKSKQNKNSLYTESLLEFLRQPLEVQEIFRKANNRTYAASKRLGQPTQYPHYIPMIYDDYYFLRRVGSPVNPPVFTEQSSIKYLDLPFAEMAYIPGGTFQMGDTRNEGGDNEKPVHNVTVNSFYLIKYEVTQRQWESVMGNNPSQFKDCLDCPVEQVSWEDTQLFLQKLNAKTGYHYRLPTEAEWEYAAGGGNSIPTRFGNGREILKPIQANFDSRDSIQIPYSVTGNYLGKTMPVGSFLPNVLGIYDMSGNVWEWCSDWYYPDYTKYSNKNMRDNVTGRVLRGGSWNSTAYYCRVAERFGISPSYQLPAFGFRIVSNAQ